MAALSATSVISEGASVTKFSSAPIEITLTPQSASDTYTHPSGVAAWAITDQVTDAVIVTFAPSTRTFTIGSASQSGNFGLLIWPAK